MGEAKFWKEHVRLLLSHGSAAQEVHVILQM